MNTKKLKHYLTLMQAAGFGPQTFDACVKIFGSFENFINADAELLIQRGLKEDIVDAIKHPDEATIDAALTWAQQNNHHILTRDDERYPALLKETVGAPFCLLVEGDINLLQAKQIAMVGSRNPTHAGREHALRFAIELSEAGYVITSGMAIGIDTASHQGALNAEQKTIAVLGSGLRNIYPKRNQKLFEKIADTGAVISEYPLNTRPAKQHFPQRNRIIAGLSLGTFVIEAAIRSGSLITAHLAADFGRDVFAMPGSLNNSQSRGTHHLIKQGAALVDSTEDILFALEGSTLVNHTSTTQNKNLKLKQQEQSLLTFIDDTVTTVDQIITRSQLPITEIVPALLTLELEGAIIKEAGGFARIV